MISFRTKSVVDWLIGRARSAPSPQDVLTELCERLSGCGLPLWRAVVFVRTLHPQVLGRRFVWRPDTERLSAKRFSSCWIARPFATVRVSMPTPAGLRCGAGLRTLIARWTIRF